MHAAGPTGRVRGVVDFLNFAIGLSEELGVDVPEADYSKLYTLDGCVDYLLTATSTGRAGPPGFP